MPPRFTVTEHIDLSARRGGIADVRKYWGRIDEDLNTGDVLLLEVSHAYNTYDFGGAKKVLLTTQSTLGGRNPAFGIIWLVFGIFLLLVTILYVLRGGGQLRGWHARRMWLEERWDRDTQRAPKVASSYVAS